MVGTVFFRASDKSAIGKKKKKNRLSLSFRAPSFSQTRAPYSLPTFSYRESPVDTASVRGEHVEDRQTPPRDVALSSRERRKGKKVERTDPSEICERRERFDFSAGVFGAAFSFVFYSSGRQKRRLFCAVSVGWKERDSGEGAGEERERECVESGGRGKKTEVTRCLTRKKKTRHFPLSSNSLSSLSFSSSSSSLARASHSYLQVRSFRTPSLSRETNALS
jgi:hypothetical protein